MLAVDPGFLSWGDVCDAAADIQVVKIKNQGRGVLNVTLAIEGAGASFFSIADEQKALSIGGNSEVEVVVTHESAGGERNKQHDANLIVTPDAGDAEEVPLKAHVADVDPAPGLSMGCIDALPLCDVAGDGACCLTAKAESKPTTRNLSFGMVGVGETSVVRVHVTNRGCGDLNVSGVRIEKLAGDTCEALTDETGAPFEQVATRDFEPFVLKGTTDPARASSREVEFAFAPELKPCKLNRKFVLLTNDPNAPPDEEGTTQTTLASGTLTGEAGQGVLEIIAPETLFGNVKMGQTKLLTVEVHNPTQTDVTIESIEITDWTIPQQNGRDQFTIEAIHRGKAIGAVIPADQPILLEKSKLSPDSVEDRITLEVRYAPTRPGTHIAYLKVNHPGAASKATRGILHGGSNPKLVAYPPSISFGNANAAGCAPAMPLSGLTECAKPNCMSAFACTPATVDADCGTGNKCLDGLCAGRQYDGSALTTCTPICGQQTRTFMLCNEGVAPADIGALRVDGSEPGSAGPVDSQRPGKPPVFTVTSSCTGTLDPDQCCTETLTYVDVRQGGVNTANIIVPNSDPSYADDERGGLPIGITSDTYLEGASRRPTVPGELIAGPFPPRAGDWITFTIDGETAPFGDDLSYTWTLTNIEGGHKLGTLPIVIDPLDPNKKCPTTVNGGNCFKVSPDRKTLSVWPELANFVYYVKVDVMGDLCDPGWVSTSSGHIVVAPKSGT